ncbi:MAG: lipopolysaccharide heptosyltransferase II [Acidobacteriota bacterium]
MKIVVRAPNWIGDAVMSIPSIKSLKKNFSNDKIYIAADKWVAGIFEGVPYIEGILEFERGGRIKNIFSNAKYLKKFKFDLGLLFTNSFRTSLEFFIAGISEIWGYRSDGRSLLLTKGIKKPKAPFSKHHVYYYMDLLTKLNLEVDEPKLEMYLSEEDLRRTEEIFKLKGAEENTLKIGINPGAYYGKAKRWVTENYGILANLLQKKFDSMIFIFGSKEEVPLSEEIAKSMDIKPVILAGETSLRELISLISRMDLFITNDSGPMHIANAFRIPIIAIFGPTNPASTAPLHQPYKVIRKELSCSPCKYRECPVDHLCMKEISVWEVFKAAEELLSQEKGIN